VLYEVPLEMFDMPGIIAADGAREGSLGSAVVLASLAVVDDELELLRVPAGSVGFLRYAAWQN
jgi:hypothetical protein